MRESLLVNTLGHSAGVLIFGIFLYLLIQDRAVRSLAGGLKSMLAGALALAWNLASLMVLGTGPSPGVYTLAIGFSVLSLLPAVLFDLSLAGRYPKLALGGYALSTVAIGLHVAELFRDAARYHGWGLSLITIGFGALTGVAAAGVFASREEHRRATTSRLVGTMSLFLLAMSFVHFGAEHAQQIWSRELAFHHAAIPLALLVLLQDYRFVLLDAFLRFLANVLLAALFVFGIVEAQRFSMLPAADTPFHQALLLAGACLALIAFALLRASVQRTLTRLLFRRPDEEALLRTLRIPIEDESRYLDQAASRLGAFMGASASVVEDGDSRASEQAGAEAVIPLRGPYGRSRFLWMGRRSGGRRYLSEDLQALGRAAGVVVEQLERFRESEMRRLVSQAELRALQSQIHPHFLFNALNTLYGIIPREARKARETVLNLADIFRYFLETRKSFLPLEEELHIVRAYLDVESQRLGDKLRTQIDIEPGALQAPIPILSVQPLVENAVKHGISTQRGGGLVSIAAHLDEDGSLRVVVRDTGPGMGQGGGAGVGLENVNRRLELCYGPAARLKIRSSADGCEVSFAIPSAVPVEAAR